MNTSGISQGICRVDLDSCSAPGTSHRNSALALYWCHPCPWTWLWLCVTHCHHCEQTLHWGHGQLPSISYREPPSLFNVWSIIETQKVNFGFTWNYETWTWYFWIWIQIYFWIHAWMYVWMLIICMYTTVLMSVLVSLWSGSLCDYVNMFLSGCKWLSIYMWSYSCVRMNM